jgi:hypothetical protein
VKKQIAVAVLALAVLAVGAFACEPCKTGETEVNGKCVPAPKPTPTPTPTPAPVATATSNSNSQSTATSQANANANANQQQGQKQNQKQSQTANGGSATATGGSATLTNSGNGGGASINETSVYNTPRQVATAIAPDTVPTSPCFKPFSGAGQGPAFGFSFGAGKIDLGCDDRETARLFAIAGNREAFAIIMCNTPAAKRAHLTIEQCKQFIPTPTPVVPEAKVEPTQTIVVPAPQVVIQTPAPDPTPVATNEGILRTVGTCKFFNARPTNACYRILDDAVLALNNSPSARLIMTGSLQATKILPYVDGKIARARIEMRLSDDQYNNLTIETWNVQ